MALAEEGLNVFEAAANILDIRSLKFIPDVSLLLEGGPSELGLLSSTLTRLSFLASLSVSLPELLSAAASLPLLKRPQPFSFDSSLPPSRLVAELWLRLDLSTDSADCLPERLLLMLGSLFCFFRTSFVEAVAESFEAARLVLGLKEQGSAVALDSF